ncbi:MAG: DUF3576 domain-containing protein [Kiloniellales bacterium]
MSNQDRAKRHGAAALALLFAIGLVACTGEETVYPRQADRRGGSTYEPRESVFGEGGLGIFGGGDAPIEDGQAGGGIGVNSYLWRASLDTISFMPLASADPFGGVIITDWYTPPESQSERFKVNVYILGRDLRADGIRAAVFRQESNQLGGWTDAKVEQQTVLDLENAILTRARQLRIAGLQ